MSRCDEKTLLVACGLNVPSVLWFKNAMAASYLKLLLSVTSQEKEVNHDSLDRNAC